MAHPDFDELLDFLVTSAQNLLAKNGEFYPIAAAMDLQGTIAAVGVHDGEEHPTSQQVIDALTMVLRSQVEHGAIRAAGICYDVLVTPPGDTAKSDAICTMLEHQNGDSGKAYVPYKKGWFGKIRDGEVFATRHVGRIFPNHDGAR